MATEIALANDDLRAERGLAKSQLPNFIVRSWQRCFDQGINPEDDRLYQAPSSRHASKSISDEYKQLLECVHPEMEFLLEAVAGPQWCVLCTDATGMVIRSLAYDTIRPKQFGAILTEGKGISEADIGTTAPGCALLERRPVRVNATEHFLNSTQGFVCAAAPIFDPLGSIVGSIDLSGVNVSARPDLLEMVSLSARMTENRLVRATGGEFTISFHAHPELVNSPNSGLLTFSADGKIIGSNSIARRYLMINKIDRNTGFSDLFEGRFEALVDMARTSRIVALDSSLGLRFFVAISSEKSRMISVRHISKASHRNQRPRRTDQDLPVFGDEALRKSLTDAQMIFEHDIPIQIVGETGTGKEVLARKIHADSKRCDGPFTVVDCSSIPPSLIEAELFGYCDGAFTSARRGGAAGKIESANRGTLFLDEIGEMPIDLQTRLLRVLQDRKVTRIGSSTAIDVDFGLITATHRDVENLIERKEFREDLYFRIRGLQVAIPPLRERSDIDELLDHFLAGPDRQTEYVFTAAARNLLHAYRWPGNIREMRQVIFVARALCGDQREIRPEHLSALLQGTKTTPIQAPDGPAPETQEGDARRELIAVLERHHYNVSTASGELGIARTTLYRRMKKLKISA